MIFRTATLEDAPQIAALHAESWQLHYRGALPDQYLDEIASQERLKVWTERLHQPTFRAATFLAEQDGVLAGFICMQLDYDEYGTMLDNLHVRKTFHGQQIGRKLMKLGAEYTAKHANSVPIYLYVLTQNTKAIAFYEKCGGHQQQKLADEEMTELGNGREVWVYRYVWANPQQLIDGLQLGDN